MSDPPQIYCFDTSSILEAWVRSYPREVFSGFWERLEALIETGNIIAPEDVRQELAHPADLMEWARGRDEMFRDLDRELQDSLKEVVVDIRKDAQARGFLLRARDLRADPVVVALAKVTGATVVTQETRQAPGGRPKIPNLCDWYGLQQINLIDFIREQGWRFE